MIFSRLKTIELLIFYVAARIVFTFLLLFLSGSARQHMAGNVFFLGGLGSLLMTGLFVLMRGIFRNPEYYSRSIRVIMLISMMFYLFTNVFFLFVKEFDFPPLVIYSGLRYEFLFCAVCVVACFLRRMK